MNSKYAEFTLSKDVFFINFWKYFYVKRYFFCNFSGTNGRVQYSIVGGDPDDQFNVDSRTGVVRTRKPLDRETRAYYTLSVQALDLATLARDRLSSTAQVCHATRNILIFSKF